MWSEEFRVESCEVWSAHIPSETHGMIMSQSATPEQLLTRQERQVFVASLIDTPTLPSRRSRTHIPPERRRMYSNVTKCHACPAKRHEHIFCHVEKDTFLWLFPQTRQLHPHDRRADTFLLKHSGMSQMCHTCHAKRHEHIFCHVAKDTFF